MSDFTLTPNGADAAAPAPDVAFTADQIAKILAVELPKRRLPIGNEIRLHHALDQVFASLLGDGVTVLPEHRLDAANRIDYFLPQVGLGLEVKVKGNASEVAHQLDRYARCQQVHHLVLITSRHTLAVLGRLSSVRDIPLTVIHIREVFLL